VVSTEKFRKGQKEGTLNTVIILKLSQTKVETTKKKTEMQWKKGP